MVLHAFTSKKVYFHPFVLFFGLFFNQNVKLNAITIVTTDCYGLTKLLIWLVLSACLNNEY